MVEDRTELISHTATNLEPILLVRPPDVSTVLAAAATGRRLPRKSTSFGPKPRMGFVMRLLDRASATTP
ncbi:MAG: DUF1015 family protein [Propionibacteriales bacterium]|nr:DUF1015 family protein [Propionibacteriales bacterium]